MESRAPGASWYALLILVLVYMVGITDRQILSIMIVPIQKDLSLTDVQISLLQGFAFATLYSTVGLLAGWAIDRFDRRFVYLISVIFWSVSCGLCGMATGFWSLFAARVGVGVGESTMTPGGYSLISDMFPKRQLSLALSIYTMGANVGVGLSFVLGGSIAAIVAAYGPVDLPIVGQVRTWQLTFIILGLLGIAVAPALLTFREPKRRGAQSTAAGLIAPAIRHFKQQPKAYSAHFLGFGLNNAIGFIVLGWTPAFLMRQYDWTQGEVGLRIGLAIGVAGALGPLCFGVLASRLSHRGPSDFHLRVPILMAPLAVLLAAGSLLTRSPALWLVAMAGIYFVTSASLVSGSAALQLMTPNQLRGRMVAVFLAVSAILGGGFGPLAVAVVTEKVLGNQQEVGTSMAVTIGLFALMQAAILRVGLSSYRSALASNEVGEQSEPDAKVENELQAKISATDL